MESVHDILIHLDLSPSPLHRLRSDFILPMISPCAYSCMTNSLRHSQSSASTRTPYDPSDRFKSLFLLGLEHNGTNTLILPARTLFLEYLKDSGSRSMPCEAQFSPFHFICKSACRPRACIMYFYFTERYHTNGVFCIFQIRLISMGVGVGTTIKRFEQDFSSLCHVRSRKGRDARRKKWSWISTTIIQSLPVLSSAVLEWDVESED